MRSRAETLIIPLTSNRQATGCGRDADPPLIANHDDQTRSAHEIATEVPDGSALPERVRRLLRRRSDAMQHRRATYQQWCDAFAGRNINDGRRVGHHIDRSQTHDIGYRTGL